MLRTLPAFLAALLLAAHFLRWGSLAPAAAAAAVPFLLLTRRAWAARVNQAVLAAGAVLWLSVLFERARERAAYGQPWLRLALILSACAALSAWAAWLLRPHSSGDKAPEARPRA